MLEVKFPNLNKPESKNQTSFLNQFMNVAIAFHQRVSSVFLPTAIKFHYLFNLRDLSNIVQVRSTSNEEILSDRHLLGNVVCFVEKYFHGSGFPSFVYA